MAKQIPEEIKKLIQKAILANKEPDVYKPLTNEEAAIVLVAVLESVNENSTSLSDVREMFATLAQELKEEFESKTDSTVRSKEEITQAFNQFKDEIKSDNRTTLRLFEQKMDSLTKMIPSEYDDSDIRELIEEIKEAIPEIPEMPESFDPSNIIERQEKFAGELEAIKTKTRTISGGITQARVLQLISSNQQITVSATAPSNPSTDDLWVDIS